MADRKPDRRPDGGSGARGEKPGSGGRWLARWLALVGVALACWWAFSYLLVPEILRWGHEGRAVPLLSDLMSGRATTPLEAYVETWRPIALGVGIAIGLLGLAALPLGFASPDVASGLRRGKRPLPRRRAAAFSLVGLLLLIAAVVVVLAHLRPVAFIHAITEDYWVEHGTFVAFFVASLLFLRAARGSSGARLLGPLAFALAAFIVAMDEISWGQRILGLETPELLEAYNYQGELTLHNVWFPTHAIVGLVAAAYAIVLPWLVARGGPLGRLTERLGVPVPRPHLRPAFLVTASLLVVADYGPALYKLDEVSELALGLCVLLLGLDQAIRSGARAWPNARAVLLSGTGTVAVVVVLTGALVTLAPNPRGLGDRLNEFAAHRYPEAGLHGQAVTLFEYMEGRPEYRTRATRLAYGRLLLELGEAERAERVLEAALRDQADPPTDWPGAVADANRNEGEIHLLLGRAPEAAAAFRRALAADRARLVEADDPSEWASAHWSLALTFKAWGHRRGALVEAARACELTHERRVLREIRGWKRRVGEEGSACDPGLVSGRLFAGPGG